MTIEDDNRRNFIRVEDTFPIEYKLLEGENLEEAKERCMKGRGYRELKWGTAFDVLQQRPGEVKESELFEAILRALFELDKKLEMVLSFLDPDKKDQAGRERPRDVVLSASGMKVALEERLKVGDLLELKITLPVFPPLITVMLAQVLRVQPKPAQAGVNLYEIALVFVAINDQDREEIIRYTFQKQREQLRQRKVED